MCPEFPKRPIKKIDGEHMKEYWNGVWSNPDIKEYIAYVKGYSTWKPKFIKIFEEHNVSSVCDVACGFGAYSVMLVKNGFNVSGFDISDKSVHLTQSMMREYGCTVDEYKVCSITKIEYADNSFCAAVAHAVIDHISLADAYRALEELFRILVPGGLLFITFDPLSADDENNRHDVLEDGSRIYEDGLLFRHYTDEDIKMLIGDKKSIYSNINKRGEREYLLRKI
jgi:ubiquinone/menaquinone biosynthesis C-methylase UbiE